MIHQRAAATEQQAGSADAAVALLRDLVAKFEARDAALRDEFAAFEAERARWNGYYAARRARAQIECSITQIGAPATGEAMNARYAHRRMLRRSATLALLLICCAAGLIGQTGRDAYRQAYDVWQQAQANLERDAGTGGAAQVAQADRAAAAAASFEATRAAYLKSSAQDAAQRRKILQTPATRSSPDLDAAGVGHLAAARIANGHPGHRQVRRR